LATTHDARRLLVTGPISRRTTLRGLGAAGIATALGMGAHDHLDAKETTSTTMIEPDAGAWKTWILTSGDQLRPEAPPDERATAGELSKLQGMVSDRDAVVLDRISYWNAGSPGYRWNELAMQYTLGGQMGPNAYRVMALLNGAIYDATIAAWDAKYTFKRPRPGLGHADLETAIPTPNSPSYPDAHAVTAGAAATVLAYLFPDDAEHFSELATEAADSRVMAGVAYPSDTKAGLTLGKAVGSLFVDYAKTDNSDAEFDVMTMPTGPGLWNGDPATLAVPMLGTWDTWVLDAPDQFRPAPPPAPDSSERAAEIAEIKTYQRDNAPATELWFWPQDPAGRPVPDSVPFSSNQVIFSYAPILHYLWGPELAQKLFEYRWDSNPPRAARAYALVSIASADSTVAAWDGKFFYWTARPNMFDPEITTVLPTYPIPDYPSGHATGLAATAQVLSYLFPRNEHFFQSRAEENAASRLWAGIHFRSADEAGLQLGRDVGDAVIAWAEADGAV
jgi:membrane-associated phospholipid phosphatase